MKKEKALNRNTSTYLVAFNPHKNAAGGHELKNKKQNKRNNNKKIIAEALRGFYFLNVIV